MTDASLNRDEGLDSEGVPYDGADLSDYLRALSDDDLAALRLDTQEDLNNIRQQLDKALTERRVTGAYADPVWFKRALTARRGKGTRIAAICAEQSRRRKARREGPERGGTAWERTFIHVVRGSVANEVWDKLVALTNGVLELRDTVTVEDIRLQEGVSSKPSQPSTSEVVKP